MHKINMCQTPTEYANKDYNHLQLQTQEGSKQGHVEPELSNKLEEATGVSSNMRVIPQNRFIQYATL